MEYIKTIIFAGSSMLLLDFVWLSFVATNFYKSQMGSLARLTSSGAFDIKLLPGGLVYLLMLIGLMVFVFPKVEGMSLLYTFFVGGLFGLLCYGIYDFTNMATLTAWPWKLAIVDMLWGGFLCGVTSVITIGLLKLFA
jgi:uncharacterized membrane protein